MPEHKPTVHCICKKYVPLEEKFEHEGEAIWSGKCSCGRTWVIHTGEALL